jgi:type II secretory pathway component PulC
MAMRFGRGLLASVLLAFFASSLAHADGAAVDGDVLPAYAPLRTVGIMIDSAQALFWDEQAKEYRLGRLGEEVYGWKIVALEQGRVLVAQAGIQDQLPLEAAPTSFLATGATSGEDRSPIASRIVIAEPPAAQEVAKPEAKPAKGAPRTLPTTPVDLQPAAPAPAAVVKAKAPAEESHTLARAELNKELGDFGRIMSAVQVKVATDGGFSIAHLQAGSWPQKIGLKEGDVVRSVAGERISTVDDAARVYARLRTLKSFDVELDRAGDPVVLHYKVTP